MPVDMFSPAQQSADTHPMSDGGRKRPLADENVPPATDDVFGGGSQNFQAYAKRAKKSPMGMMQTPNGHQPDFNVADCSHKQQLSTIQTSLDDQRDRTRSLEGEARSANRKLDSLSTILDVTCDKAAMIMESEEANGADLTQLVTIAAGQKKEIRRIADELSIQQEHAEEVDDKFAHLEGRIDDLEAKLSDVEVNVEAIREHQMRDSFGFGQQLTTLSAMVQHLVARVEAGALHQSVVHQLGPVSNNFAGPSHVFPIHGAHMTPTAMAPAALQQMPPPNAAQPQCAVQQQAPAMPQNQGMHQPQARQQ